MNKTPILPPFKRFCVTIGNLPSSYVDSMSYYECVMWLCKYLKDTVIPAVNENAEAVNELINWFNNLDVQDEIDDKLDRMVEDGTMSEIINQEIFSELNNTISNIEDDVEELQNKTDYFNIEPKQLFIDDIGNYNIQGGCIDDNNVLYVYRDKGTNTGDILKYNLNSNTYIGIIEDVKLYHGNSLTYKNGKIYATAFKDSSNNFSTLICVYDITNNTVSELDLFNNNYAKSVGICSFDEDNLLIALETNTSTEVKNLAFVKLNLNTLNYEVIPTNYGNLNLNNNSLIAEIEKRDNKVYIQTSEPNQIFEMDLTSTGLTFNKIYNLPKIDDIGLFIGESEVLSFFPSNTYGKYTAVYISQMYDTVSLNNVTLKAYIISFETNLSNQISNIREQIYQNQTSNIYVNATSSSMLEYGTKTNPFKTLNRAINALNNDNTRVTANIMIDDSSTYEMSVQTNKKIYITNSNNTTPKITNIDTFNRCDIDIRSVNTNNRITLEGVFSMQNSNVFCQLINFTKSNIIINNNDKCTFYQCNLDSTDARYDNCISVNKSIVNLGFDSITNIPANGKAVYISTSGVVYMNYYTSAQPRTAQSGSFVFTTE